MSNTFTNGVLRETREMLGRRGVPMVKKGPVWFLATLVFVGDLVLNVNLKNND